MDGGRESGDKLLSGKSALEQGDCVWYMYIGLEFHVRWSLYIFLDGLFCNLI